MSPTLPIIMPENGLTDRMDTCNLNSSLLLSDCCTTSSHVTDSDNYDATIVPTTSTTPSSISLSSSPSFSFSSSSPSLFSSRSSSSSSSTTTTTTTTTTTPPRKKGKGSCSLSHVCHTCGKRFDRLYNLKVHTRKHTGETPYTCMIKGCSRHFKWRSSLAHHLRAHHDAADLQAVGLKPDALHLYSSSARRIKKQPPTTPTTTPPQQQQHDINYILNKLEKECEEEEEEEDEVNVSRLPTDFFMSQNHDHEPLTSTLHNTPLHGHGHGQSNSMVNEDEDFENIMQLLTTHDQFDTSLPLPLPLPLYMRTERVGDEEENKTDFEPFTLPPHLPTTFL